MARLSLFALIAFVLSVSAARATQVTGTMTYLDDDGTKRAIVDVIVEVWRQDGVIWSNVASTRTLADGTFRVDAPFRAADAKYTVRILAENSAVKVFDSYLTRHVFYVTPGTPGIELQRTAASATATIDFTHHFFHPLYVDYFNVAETIRLARAWVDLRRDPQETDKVDQAWAWVIDGNSIGGANDNTFFNQPIGAIQYDRKHGYTWDDATVIHEYAHYVESKISKFIAVPTIHYACKMYFGGEVKWSQVAWMEGFADWMAAAVINSYPRGTFNVHGRTGSFGPAVIEPHDDCGGSSGDTVEKFVAGVLWDLYDSPGDPSFDASEEFDVAARRDRLIMSIFDREMTKDSGYPTMTTFVRHWRARGFDRQMLDRILAGNHIDPPP